MSSFFLNRTLSAHASQNDSAALLSIRLLSLDYVLRPPLCPELDPMYSNYRSGPIKRLPILRIFGPTLSGQKTILHIHGVFPYLYVRVPSNSSSDPEEFGYRLTLSLDKAMNMVLGSGSEAHHVYRVVPVRAKSMYGYHVSGEETFLKIYFYNPGLVKKAADLLHHGAVMDQMIEPYESHIPFTLQFMMDYNLQGMNLLHLSHALFRIDSTERSLPSQSLSRPDLLSIPAQARRIAVHELSSELILNPSTALKTTRSSLEVDAVASDILNTQCEANPGLRSMWEDEVIRRRAKGLNEDEIPNPSSPTRGEIPPTRSEEFWRDKFNAKMRVESSKEEVETSLREGRVLPLSNVLESHVPSLGGGSEQGKRKETQEEDSQISAYWDETIINEEVISSLSQPDLSSGLDEDEQELVKLLAMDKTLRDSQVDKGAIAAAPSSTEEQEVIRESFEMSQIDWFSDNDIFSQE